jgi:hypothetical protein
MDALAATSEAHEAPQGKTPKAKRQNATSRAVHDVPPSNRHAEDLAAEGQAPRERDGVTVPGADHK